MGKWIIFFTIIIQNLLCADENVYDLDFHALKDQSRMEFIKGKKVKIRGFLYSNGKDEWILAADPHLKTCCIGSKEKAAQQIFLDGKFSEKLVNQVIEVEGILNFDPNENEGRYYSMSELVKIKNDKSHAGIILAGLGVVLVVVWMGKKYYTHREH